MASHLVLLDVSGVMCAKISSQDMEHIFTDYVSINTNYAVLIRPGIKEAILGLSQKYQVGIYSSTKYYNLIKIINAIFGPKHPFVMIADRSTTLLHPQYGVDPTIKEYDTIKSLNLIWSHPILNSKRIWNATNTICVDHDLHKLDTNSPENICIVPEFTYQDYLNDQNHIQDLILAIESKIDGIKSN